MSEFEDVTERYEPKFESGGEEGKPYDYFKMALYSRLDRLSEEIHICHIVYISIEKVLRITLSLPHRRDLIVTGKIEYIADIGGDDDIRGSIRFIVSLPSSYVDAEPTRNFTGYVNLVAPTESWKKLTSEEGRLFYKIKNKQFEDLDDEIF